MGRRLASTPRSRVRSALRQVFLRSREHAATLKRDKNSCVQCGVKASKAKGREVKVEVHHIAGVTNWKTILDMVFKELLVHPDNMETLCEKCHKEKTPPE